MPRAVPWAGRRRVLIIEADYALAGSCVVVGFKAICSVVIVDAGFAESLQVKTFSRAILVLNAGDFNITDPYRNGSGAGGVFWSGVTNYDREVDWYLRCFAVSVLTSVKHHVFAWASGDFEQFSFGIHTNTSFLKELPKCIRKRETTSSLLS